MSRGSFVFLLVFGMVLFSVPHPAQASENRGANEMSAGKLLAARQKSARRIAVMRFSGPTIVDVDADIVWKKKNKVDVPGKGELSGLTSELQKSLTAQLSARLGSTVVPASELNKALSNTTPKVGGAGIDVAKKVGARYLVSGTIDRIEFDGNTVLKDGYVLIVTTKIIDADNGGSVWAESGKKFLNKVYTRKTGKTVYDTFKDKQIPDVAGYLTGQIASAIGR